MHDLARLPPLRSKKVLRHAKGQRCTLRLRGICNDNPETTVPCHIRDRHKSMGRKSSDSSMVFGCSACHDHLDHHFFDAKKLPTLELWQCIVRAMQETLEILIRDKVIGWPEDKEPAPRKARKAKAEPKVAKPKPDRASRRKIPTQPMKNGRGFGPGKRPMRSRPKELAA